MGNNTCRCGDELKPPVCPDCKIAMKKGYIESVDDNEKTNWIGAWFCKCEKKEI